LSAKVSPSSVPAIVLSLPARATKRVRSLATRRGPSPIGMKRSRPRVHWAEGEAATLGNASHAFEVGGLSIDTRTLKPGDLFVALKGDARDGHEFVKAALAAKAGAAMVQRVPGDVAQSATLLSVANTQRGLEDLARAARA